MAGTTADDQAPKTPIATASPASAVSSAPAAPSADKMAPSSRKAYSLSLVMRSMVAPIRTGRVLYDFCCAGARG